MEGGKKCLCVIFWADQKITSSQKKKCFGASYSKSNKVIAYCQTHYDYGPPKVPLKLAV